MQEDDDMSDTSQKNKKGPGKKKKSPKKKNTPKKKKTPLKKKQKKAAAAPQPRVVRRLSNFISSN